MVAAPHRALHPNGMVSKAWVLSAVLLSGAMLGCASTQQRVAAEVQKATRACESLYAPRSAENISALARCLNDAERPLAPLVLYPDLFNLVHAARTYFAEKVESGSMSLSEAELGLASIMTQVQADAERRNIGRQQAAAAEASAFSASAAAFSASAAAASTAFAPRTLPAPAAPRVTCHRMGAYTNCW